MIDEVGKFFTVGSRLVAGVAGRFTSEKDLSEIISSVLADNNVTPTRALVYGSVTVILAVGTTYTIYKVWSHYNGSSTSASASGGHVLTKLQYRIEDLKDAYERGTPEELQSAHAAIATLAPTVDDLSPEHWELYNTKVPEKIAQNEERARAAAETAETEQQSLAIEHALQLLTFAIQTDHAEEISGACDKFERTCNLPVYSTDWDRLLRYGRLKALTLSLNPSFNDLTSAINALERAWTNEALDLKHSALLQKAVGLQKASSLQVIKDLTQGDMDYDAYNALRLQVVNQAISCHSAPPIDDLASLDPDTVNDPDLKGALANLKQSIDDQALKRDAAFAEIQKFADMDIADENLDIKKLEECIKTYERLGGNIENVIKDKTTVGGLIRKIQQEATPYVLGLAGAIGTATTYTAKYEALNIYRNALKRLDSSLDCEEYEEQLSEMLLARKAALDAEMKKDVPEFDGIEHLQKAWEDYRECEDTEDTENLRFKAAKRLLDVMVPHYEDLKAETTIPTEVLRNLQADYLAGREPISGIDAFEQRISALLA